MHKKKSSNEKNNFTNLINKVRVAIESLQKVMVVISWLPKRKVSYKVRKSLVFLTSIQQQGVNFLPISELYNAIKARLK